MTIFVLVFWIAFSVAVGIAAHRRFGRNGQNWSALAFLISPLLAGAFLFALGPKTPGVESPKSEPRPLWQVATIIVGIFAVVIVGVMLGGR